MAHVLPATALKSKGRDKAFEQVEPEANRKRDRIRIHIGEYHASDKPASIQTTLGSCVSVCLFDPDNRVGGMNHILMPGSADMNRFDTTARYGVNAMELLINRMMSLGGVRSRFLAKVFGGAHLLQSISRQNGMGRRNIEFVFKFLEMERIRVVSQEVGGHASRIVYFHTDTGNVFLKRNYSDYYESIAAEEIAQYRRIQKEAQKAGEIIYFEA